MNRLTTQKRAQILSMMVEGMSIRSISRLTGASKNTIVKLLDDAGRACFDYQEKHLRNLTCKRLQLDEVWSFVYAKDKNAPAAMKAAGEAGDVWTWTAIDADTKLIASWMVGDRTSATARDFVTDLASRLSNRVQITTDGHRAYLKGMEAGFGGEVDYAMLDKIYGTISAEGQRRYSPAECIGVKHKPITGNPDPKHISTSYAERQNLSMRMGMRRFTRLTNAFSKKLENHIRALSTYFMHYNFVRQHQTLRVSPAMAAGVSQTLWSMEDVVRMVEKFEATRDQTAA